jgi:hypothetical protein
MRFLRHDGIYRSDVTLPLVNPVQIPPPVGRPRYQAIGRDGRSTPCPSSAMSSGRLFLDRGGRHQSPSPLRRDPQNKSLALRHASPYHRTAGSVLTVCVSRGDKRRLTLSWRSGRQPDCQPSLFLSHPRPWKLAASPQEGQHGSRFQKLCSWTLRT